MGVLLLTLATWTAGADAKDAATWLKDWTAKDQGSRVTLKVTATFVERDPAKPVIVQEVKDVGIVRCVFPKDSDLSAVKPGDTVTVSGFMGKKGREKKDAADTLRINKCKLEK